MTTGAGGQMLQGFNINTMLNLLSMTVVVGGLVYVQGQTNAKFELQAAQTAEQLKYQQAWNATLEADRKASRTAYEQQNREMMQIIAKQAAGADQMNMQVGMLQKADENTDARINRITESYAQRFEAMQEAINEIKTGQALTTQTQSEIKDLLTKRLMEYPPAGPRGQR